MIVGGQNRLAESQMRRVGPALIVVGIRIHNVRVAEDVANRQAWREEGRLVLYVSRGSRHQCMQRQRDIVSDRKCGKAVVVGGDGRGTQVLRSLGFYSVVGNKHVAKALNC